MYAGQDKTYKIVKNRAVLILYNVATETIAEVYFREDNSNKWSENYLEGFLFQDGSIYLPVEEKYDWIKIVDMYGTEFPEQEIELIAGENIEFYFTGND
jgi:hypothetical protein